MAFTLDLPRSLPEHPVRAGACLALVRIIVRVARNRIHAWMVWRTIENLHRLDDRILEDIGIPRSEIEFRVRELMPRHW
jgi:uncharacterized protein YjiS (DUF1127 family)